MAGPIYYKGIHWKSIRHAALALGVTTKEMERRLHKQDNPDAEETAHHIDDDFDIEYEKIDVEAVPPKNRKGESKYLDLVESLAACEPGKDWLKVKLPMGRLGNVRHQIRSLALQKKMRIQTRSRYEKNYEILYVSPKKKS